jgi:D-alanine-D-alanine ligase
VVGWRAKWEESSAEYESTVRRHAFPASDSGLLEELSRVALACWSCFDLSGYARVDARVDPAGRPFVLEVNANPCLTPDAGFCAAAARAGLSLRDILARIVARAMQGRLPA